MLKLLCLPAIAFIIPMLSGCTACTPLEQQQALAAITPGAACVADIVLQLTGTEEVAGIVANCSVAAQDVAQIVGELLKQDAVAPAPIVSDAGEVVALARPTLKPEMRAHLFRIQTNAMKMAGMDAAIVSP